jgi:hypothetical protein
MPVCHSYVCTPLEMIDVLLVSIRDTPCTVTLWPWNSFLYQGHDLFEINVSLSFPFLANVVKDPDTNWTAYCQIKLQDCFKLLSFEVYITDHFKHQMISNTQQVNCKIAVILNFRLLSFIQTMCKMTTLMVFYHRFRSSV